MSKNTLEDKLTCKFKGMIAFANPKSSWVVRYLDSCDYAPGF